METTRSAERELPLRYLLATRLLTLLTFLPLAAHSLIPHIQAIAEQDGKVLIFVNTKRIADDLTHSLRQQGWPALSIHGDKEQGERQLLCLLATSRRADVTFRRLGAE